MADFARRIYDTMKKRNLPFAEGPGEIEIVYVEGCNGDGTPNANRHNAFDDVRVVLRFENGQPKIADWWPATTAPGTLLTQNPVADARAKGAAIIELGQQRCWQVGLHRGYEALVQTGAVVTVARDKNKDYSREGDERTTGFYGINQHHGGDAPVDNIGGHSAGCLVGRSVKGHREFMELVKSDPRYKADRKFVFRTTVIPYAWLEAIPKQSVPRSAAPISRAAIDLIVAEEVSGQRTYEEKYRRPEWPGGASGVTIGIGYDVGAGVSSVTELQRDWQGKIPQSMIDALMPCIGVTGARAKTLAESLQDDVDVPWAAAMDVFQNATLPKYYAITAKALPNFDKLSPDCKGALVSLVYNRGASFGAVGDRYREMRAIKQYMEDQRFAVVPDELRKMKRLWEGQGLPGLLARRDREAKLFEEGLKKPAVPQIVKDTVAVGVPVVVGGWSLWDWIVANPIETTFIVAAIVAVGVGALRWYRQRGHQ